jgi:hypothetical protein
VANILADFCERRALSTHNAWRSAPAFFPALHAEPFSHLSIGISALVMDRNAEKQRLYFGSANWHNLQGV